MKQEEKIAAVYVRVSSESQRRQQTINSQLEAVLMNARERGWAIDKQQIFADNGYSGATLARPGLDALRDLVAHGVLAYVLVLSPDRLSRKFAYQVLLQEEFERYNTRIVFVEEPDNATPQQVLLRQILSVLSEYERTQIAERSRRGKLYRARQGSLNMISKPPYGYDLIRKTETSGARLVINASEAAVVRLIFKLYTEKGGTIPVVARKLDALGHNPRHAKYWGISTISSILRNEAYIGKAAYQKTMTSEKRVRHNRTGRSKNGAVRRLYSRTARPREEWITLRVPPIVDEATFQRAKERRKHNRRFSVRNTRAPSLLQGLCICAHCGYAMGRLQHKNSRRKYYRCNGTEGWRFPEGAVCDNPSVNAEDLDVKVWKAVVGLLEAPELIQAEIGRRTKAARNKGPAQRRKDELQKERLSCGRQSRRLVDAYQQGLINLDELRDRTGPLQTRQRAIESELRALQADRMDAASTLTLAHSVQKFVARMHEGEKDLSITERQQLVRLLVREVRVGKTEVTVCHCIPLAPSADPKQRSDTPLASPASENDFLIPRRGQVKEGHGFAESQELLRGAEECIHDRLTVLVEGISDTVKAAQTGEVAVQ